MRNGSATNWIAALTTYEGVTLDVGYAAQRRLSGDAADRDIRLSNESTVARSGWG